MIVYGRNPVHEAIRGPRGVHRIWATSRAAREPWLCGREVAQASAEEIARRCGSGEHQGICAETDAYAYADPPSLLSPSDALVLCLDGVEDPQNLGAICRVAECAGASGVVIPERRAAAVSAAVARASAGAVEHLAIARVRNVADYLASAKAAGAWVYGAAPSAAAVPYDVPDYRGRVVVVLGAEGRGLRPRVSAACDRHIALPLRGRVESLNVATAASAILYGILHFRAIAVDKTT